jgi:hypothetical protein
MRTVVRACIRPGMREPLKQAVQGPACPPALRKAFEAGRYEGDICYFTVGGLLGDPWPEVKPFVDQYFEIEWQKPQPEVDKDELVRIGKLHTLRAKLGLGA